MKLVTMLGARPQFVKESDGSKYARAVTVGFGGWREAAKEVVPRIYGE